MASTEDLRPAGIRARSFAISVFASERRIEEFHLNCIQPKSSLSEPNKTAIGLFSAVIFFVRLLLRPSRCWLQESSRSKRNPPRPTRFTNSRARLRLLQIPTKPRRKIKTAFDLKELEQMGIVPVHIIISNDGEDPIAISGQDINLLDSNNRSFESMPVDEVVRAIVYKESPRTSRNPSPIPFPRGSGRRGDAFEIETDLTNKSLREVRVSPRTTSGGFVFFRLPNNRMKLGGYKVYIPEIRNVKTRQSLLFFEIDLK